MASYKCPSTEDLRKAKKVFLEKEPRNLFYRVACELIQLAINGKTDITLSEALAVLLQTWNRAYYRFRPFDNAHFSKIDQLVENYGNEIITGFRSRSILSVSEADEVKVRRIFTAFEEVLGPVGAAKSLHLLAPHFFPLWDRAIAETYEVGMGAVGTNEGKYWIFMEISRTQCHTLDKALGQETNLLKSIDEYNYCHHTKEWI